MLDTLTDPTQQEQQPPITPGLPGLDVASIDAKLQAVDHVQSAWGLPALPQETKLDLASHPGMDHQGLSDFLWGLASDVNAKVNPFSAAPAFGDTATANQPQQDSALDTSPDSLHNQIRKAFTDLTNNPPAAILANDSPQYIKQRAVRAGLLPGDTDVTSGLWDPSLDVVRTQLASQDFQDRLSGDKTGSMSVKKVIGFLGDFVTPSTLGKTAVALGVLPTKKAAKGLFSSGWQVLTNWVDHPTDGKAFLDVLHAGVSYALPGESFVEGGFDKLTGRKMSPVTQNLMAVQLPILNDALMVAGVGEVIGIGRAALGGAEAVDLADRGLYTARGAQAFQRAQEASLLSKGLTRGGTALLTSDSGVASAAGQRLYDAGQALQQWRHLSGVAAARATVGALGRRAIVGTAEQKLFPELDIYGSSPANLLGAHIHSGKDLQDFKDRGAGNPITSVLDVALAPPSYFAPGSFTQLGSTTKALAKGLVRVSDDSRLTAETARGLAGIVTDPEKAAALRGSNPTQALIDHFGSKETAGAFTSWATSIAAIDKDAVRIADNAVRQADQPAKWKSLYLNARNSQIAKLAHIDEGDVDVFINRLAPKVAGGKASDAMTQWSNLLTDPATSDEARATMNATIADHNGKRAGVMTQLVSQLAPGDVEKHIGRFFANDENFGNFVEAHDLVNRMFKPSDVFGEALLTPEQQQALHYRQAFSEAGRPVGGVTDIDPTSSVVQHLYDTMRHDPSAVTDAYFAPLARKVGPDAPGRFGLARNDSVVKQDALELISLHSGSKRQVDLLTWLEKNPTVQQKLIDAGAQNLGDMGRQDFVDAVQGTDISKRTRDAARLIHTLATTDDGAYGFANDFAGAVSQARRDAQATLAGVDVRPDWAEKYGIPQGWKLDDKVKELKSLSHYMAAEVEGLPEHLSSRLSGLGYKMVHGGEFVMPNDVLDTVRPFTEVTHSELSRMSLGQFVSKVDNTTAGRALTQKLHSDLSASLIDAGVLDAGTLRAQMARNEDGVPGQIIHALWDEVHRGQETTNAAVDQAKSGGLLNKLLANAQSSVTPLGTRDLVGGSRIEQALKASGDMDVAALADNPHAVAAIRQSILDSFDLGWRYNGLAGIEDKLRRHNVLNDALKVWSNTDGAATMNRLSRGAVGAGVGGVAGGISAVVAGKTPEDIAKQTFAGALAGGAYGAAPNLAGRVVAGGIAGGAANALTGNGSFMEGAKVGAVAGAATALPGVRNVVGAVADAAQHAVSGSKWYQYAYLPDELARVRNLVRFTLNPVFDMRRYAKGALLAQLEQLPEGVSLPLNNSLGSLGREYGPGAVQEARGLWNNATHGEYGVLDDAERYFAQRGMLGYSGKDYMASANYRLIKQGVDPEQAAGIVQHIYAYGTGRSPLEKSVNFVLFPFSFEKKVVSASAKFLADDTSRLVVLHDALKTYDVLNSKYNLSKMWEEHLPVLGDLQKMNAFQHGISPGELGGINAPILNAFLPQMLHLSIDGSYQSLQHTVQRLVPVYNDVNRLVDDTVEQGHVAFSKTHVTTQAEADRGYALWNDFKRQVDGVAKEQGYKDGFNSVMRRPDLASFKEYVHAYKAQVEDQYPGFRTAQQKAISHRLASEDEINHIVADPKTTAQQELADFHDYEAGLVGLVKDQLGVNMTQNPELVPPDIYQAARAAAIELASRGHGFEALYDKYYRRSYGPISRSY